MVGTMRTFVMSFIAVTLTACNGGFHNGASPSAVGTTSSPSSSGAGASPAPTPSPTAAPSPTPSPTPTPTVAPLISSAAVNVLSTNGYYFSATDGGGYIVSIVTQTAPSTGALIINDLTQPGFFDGDKVTIQAPNGYYLSAECGGELAPPIVSADLSTPNPFAGLWETFKIHKISGSAGSMIQNGDNFNFKSSGGYDCTAERTVAAPEVI